MMSFDDISFIIILARILRECRYLLIRIDNTSLIFTNVDHSWLDIYIPIIGLLLIFAQVKQDTPRFRVLYREGPEGAPYHSLCLDGIIDGPMSHGEYHSS